MITDIKIERSKRRRRTASAKMVNNVMHLRVPSDISCLRLEQVIDSFRKKFSRKMLKKRLNREKSLDQTAKIINNKYFGGKLQVVSIEYAVNQNYKYGCCDFTAKKIRISQRIAEMPDWVRDYVIVHEMAHLIEPNHSNSFWDIVSRYKLAERARGYLIAKSIEPEEQADMSGPSGKERLNEADS